MTARLALSIDDRRLFADGLSFGEAGGYERLTGRVRFLADPAGGGHPRIVDLDKAPRTAEGMVEYAADFCLLKPVEPARGNRRVDHHRRERQHRIRRAVGCGQVAGPGPAGRRAVEQRPPAPQPGLLGCVLRDVHHAR